MDVFWIGGNAPWGNRKIPILHMVDVAARFGTARVLAEETGAEVIKALTRGWLKPYGCPKVLQCDEARPFNGEELRTFLERRNIELDVSPGEAHWRLGIIERRHDVLRTALETFLDEENLPPEADSVRTALEYVAPVLNELAFTRGYTPAQWVLNKNPQDPTSITHDTWNPSAHHDALTLPAFEEELERRKCARMAFIKADSDARLRRALLRKHRTIKMPLVVANNAFTGGMPARRAFSKIDGVDQPR